METKLLSFERCEIKMMHGGAASFEGYASVFGGVDSYGDTIVKGAFEYSLRKYGKPKMFVNHFAFDLPVGKWLTAKEDDKGLFMQGEFTPGMRHAEDVAASVKHGTVDGLSIGFRLDDGDYEAMSNGGRLIKRISKLVETSIVTFPADSAARISSDSIKNDALAAMSSEREFETFLRDAGVSRTLAKGLVSKARELFCKRDAGGSGNDEIAAIVQRINSILI